MLDHLRAGLAADDALKLAHHGGERVRSGGSAEQIMGGFEARRPVAQRLIDRILQCAPTAFHRNDVRPHQLHAEDVQLLPVDVLRAHVNDRLEAQQSTNDRGGDAVLAGAGLGDQARLAHPFGEQPLGEHLVGLVRTAVEQVFALEEDVARQVAAASQRPTRLALLCLQGFCLLLAPAASISRRTASPGAVQPFRA